MTMLSRHFSESEFLRSVTAQNHGINNTWLSERHKANAKALAETLENVRDYSGDNPIHISSGYRVPELNKLVGGAPESWHTKGLAADIYSNHFNPSQLFNIISGIAEGGHIELEELIKYPSFVHIAIKAPEARKEEARKEAAIVEHNLVNNEKKCCTDGLKAGIVDLKKAVSDLEDKLEERLGDLEWRLGQIEV